MGLISAMGPFRLTCDIGKFFWGWYQGEDGQAEARARKLIWAVERAAISFFIYKQSRRFHKELHIHQFSLFGIIIALSIPETSLGFGSYVFKHGFDQIAYAVRSNPAQSSPDFPPAEIFLKGVMHVSFTVAFYIYHYYRSSGRPLLNTYLPDVENFMARGLTTLTTSATSWK